jgi:uncharacterized phage protein (TIGR02218 family)
MRSASWETSPGALAALLNSGAPLNACDLYEIRLQGGTVIRWTSAAVGVSAAGFLWTVGPGIERGRCKWVVGIEVDTLEITFLTDDAHPVLISGIPLLAFIGRDGLAGADITLFRAFWGNANSAPVGTLLWFKGRTSDIQEITRGHARVLAKSALERLTMKVPRQAYQAQCLNTVYDSNCGVSRAANTTSGAATSASTLGRTQFTTNIGAAAGTFDLGTLTWTSGPNLGVARTVKRQAAGGVITVLSPLPSAVASGHTFTIVPGCDGTPTVCSGRFSNLLRFRGQPYIPQPETVT